MLISILTLFPEMFGAPFDYSIIKRATEQGIVTINLINIRDFATDKYKSVDDHPYGGGVGMILRVDVVDRALDSVKRIALSGKRRTILLDPRGTVYTQGKARELTTLDHLILICGHYEGVDERVTSLVDESISIGDYIVTGGEIPAMVVVDSVVRLIPGVLKKEGVTKNESFSFSSASRMNAFTHQRILEYPQYTRPKVYKRMRVPDVLLSGDHKKIAAWRNAQSLLRTTKQRPYRTVTEKRG